MGYDKIAASLRAGLTPESDGPIKVYEKSLLTHGDVKLIMVRDGQERRLVAAGSGSLYDELKGSTYDGYKVAPADHENRLVLNRYFPHTAPQAFGKRTATIGLGDRLGLAGPGHVKAIDGRDIKPVLAQQSIRELKLTGRDYKQVLDAACYAVIQEGYTGGFGADGDHLKLEEDIRMSIDLGFTMLTLDCSDYIRGDVERMNEREVSAAYEALPLEERERIEAKFLDRTFEAGEHRFHYDRANLQRNALIYGDAIRYMVHVYERFIKNAPRTVDFEISIDETMTPTTPEAHYFVARQLVDQGVDIVSMAPRFCGEFQKGIDYIGDLSRFEMELRLHAAIADHFGYKLSIHSGSDKFSVFPMIGDITKGRFHLKTAGTNWLEAVRIVAKVNPQLYRRMHQYALEHFDEARAYYHVTTDLTKIKPLSEVADDELPSYMDEDNARQLIHITYGVLLQAKDDRGAYRFKTELYDTLIREEQAYEQALVRHIGRHLSMLGK